MLDLETHLRTYAIFLDEQFPDVLAEEVMERETQVITLSRIPKLVRARRPFIGPATVLGLAVVLAGAVVLLTTGGRPTASQPSTESTVSEVRSDLGIFEAVRGQIVFNSWETGGGPIQVVDPTDPASVRNFEFDFPLEIALIPTGWSADGSTLAITDEYHGDRYVIDGTGRAKKAQSGGGCCSFTDSNWLSPDGALSAAAFPGEGSAPGHIAVTGFDDSPQTPHGIYELPQFEWPTGPVWSPAGTQIAVVAYRNVGEFQEATLHIIDLENGSVRDLLASEYGHIRNIAWSPDGSQILVIAGEFQNTVALASLNPYVNPIATSIYVLSPDGSGLQWIAEGYYVAASWSPDGAQIATIDFDGQRRITVMNADGSEERIVAEMSAGQLFSGLAWHPVP